MLTHPKHDVWKTYQAQVIGVPGAEEIARLQQGVLLPEGKTAPARVKILRVFKEPAGRALLEIVLREGKKRQVRKMCEAVGHPVIELRRTNLAFLTLEGLRPGQYRRLTPGEVSALKEIAFRGEDDDRCLEVWQRNAVPERDVRNEQRLKFRTDGKRERQKPK